MQTLNPKPETLNPYTQDSDLDCNPCAAKHVSNVRTAGKDEFIQVSKPREIFT
jgi:predicted membrane GTPase involved in stress response